MTEDDFLYDRLLLNPTELSKSNLYIPIHPEQDNPTELPKPGVPSCKWFLAPVTKKDLLDKISGTVPMGTRSATACMAATVWHDWSEGRQSAGADAPPPLEGIDNEQLGYCLPRFVIEARNRKGGAYIPSSLYSLCTGIQRFVRNESVKIGGPTLDIYKDPGFVLFRNVLDNTLKELHSMWCWQHKEASEGYK